MKKTVLKTPELIVIYYRESLIQSVLADTYLYFLVMLSFWIDYKFIGGGWSGFGFFIFSLFVISMSLKSKTKTFTGKEKFKGYILNDLRF